jgi:hypothetical protein
MSKFKVSCKPDMTRKEEAAFIDSIQWVTGYSNSDNESEKNRGVLKSWQEERDFKKSLENQNVNAGGNTNDKE